MAKKKTKPVSSSPSANPSSGPPPLQVTSSPPSTSAPPPPLSSTGVNLVVDLKNCKASPSIAPASSASAAVAVDTSVPPTSPQPKFLVVDGSVSVPSKASPSMLASSGSLLEASKSSVVAVSGTPLSEIPQKSPQAKLAWTDIVQGIGSKMTKKGAPFMLESGELCVKIPNSVITKNARNWDNFIIGQFHGKPPNRGTLHAIANGIWSKTQRDITVSRLTDRAFLIRIPNVATRKRVLAQGMWHIDNQSMFVAKWEPGFNPEMPELTSVPVWLEFRNVPLQFFNEEGLEHIAGLIGEPKFLHPSTANMTNLEVAKVFTVVDPLKPLPETVNVQFESGQVQKVEVSSPWLPPVCSHCQEVGHGLKNCPSAPITCIRCNSSGHSADLCTRVKQKIISAKKTDSEIWVKKTSPIIQQDLGQKRSLKVADKDSKVDKDSKASAINLTQEKEKKLASSIGKISSKERRALGISIGTPTKEKAASYVDVCKGKGKEISHEQGYNSPKVAGHHSGYTSSDSSESSESDSESDWGSGEDDNENYVPYISKKLMRQLRALRQKQSPQVGGSNSHH